MIDKKLDQSGSTRGTSVNSAKSASLNFSEDSRMRVNSESGQEKSSAKLRIAFLISVIGLAINCLASFMELSLHLLITTYRALCLVYTHPASRPAAWHTYWTLLTFYCTRFWRSISDMNADPTNLSTNNSIQLPASDRNTEPLVEIENKVNESIVNWDSSIFTDTPRSSTGSFKTSEWNEDEVLSFLGLRRATSEVDTNSVNVSMSSWQRAATAVTSVVSLDIVSASTQPLSPVQEYNKRLVEDANGSKTMSFPLTSDSFANENSVEEDTFVVNDHDYNESYSVMNDKCGNAHNKANCQDKIAFSLGTVSDIEI